MNTQTTPTKGSHSIFAHPLGTVGIVFGGIGLIFTLLGATFAAANAELLPEITVCFDPFGNLGDDRRVIFRGRFVIV